MLCKPRNLGPFLVLSRAGIRSDNTTEDAKRQRGLGAGLAPCRRACPCCCGHTVTSTGGHPLGPVGWEALFPFMASATFYTNCFSGRTQWPWIMAPVCL